jgi:LysM repeat protein
MGSTAGDAASGGADRGSLLEQGNGDATVADGSQVAEAPPEPQNYTVTKGDNLWNIAKDHLGSGTRWQEIYQLNSDVIGQNPDLIYAGTDLKMPVGAENLASSDYMVKAGDNLWNIARDHMGGGQHWPDIYNQNVGVIGSNPNLIHPGQHLAVPGEGQGMQLAHTNAGTGAANHTAHNAAGQGLHAGGHGHGSHGHGVAHHAKPAHTAHHGDSAGHHTAHAKGADHHVAKGADHGAAKTHEIAHSSSPADAHAQEYGTPGSQEVAEAAAATKEQIGLKAVAGSL